MPCYSPLTGYRSRSKNESGKYPVVFNVSDGWIDKPVQVPCGQCIGCRLERSRIWAMRCLHEASLYDNNCFITLTFNDDYVMPSLDKSIFQKFMKRLRRFMCSHNYVPCENGEGFEWVECSDNGVRIRYFMCGEYGDKLSRPHYHACLFGFDFPDRVLWSVRDNVRLYRSSILEKLWCDPKNGNSFGFSTVGDVSFESAAYVARYCMKKVTGEKADAHYNGRQSEYVTMSRRPGIGLAWLKKFYKDVYPSDEVVIRGNVKCKPARYYDEKFGEMSLTNEKVIAKLKLMRKKKAAESPDNSIRRLQDRETIKRQRVANLRRSYHEVTNF